MKQEVTDASHSSHDRQHEGNGNGHASNDAAPAKEEEVEAGSSRDAAAVVTEGRQLVDGASAQGSGLQYGLTASIHQDSDRR